MIPENVRTVIERLGRKTTSGETIWNKSSASNGYKIDLNSAVISINTWSDTYNQNTSYYLTILNDRGETIESITCEDRSDPDYDLLKNLYDIVNRKYLKVDETLKSVLDEIASSLTIGIEVKSKTNEKPSDAIDDLPF